MANTSKKTIPSNFERLPERIENPDSALTFGDVHTQDINLIRSLYENSVLNIDESDYQELQNIFQKCQGASSSLTQKDIKEFDAIMAKTTVNSSASIHFNAESAEESKGNAYFTLKILQKLKENGVSVTIDSATESSKVFVNNYNTMNFFDASMSVGRKIIAPTASMYGLQKLLENKCVSFEQIDQLISQTYLTSLQPQAASAETHISVDDDKEIAAERKNINALKYKLYDELCVSYGATKRLILKNTSLTEEEFNQLDYLQRYQTSDAKDAHAMMQCIQSIRLETFELHKKLLSTLNPPVQVQQNQNSFLADRERNIEKGFSARYGKIASPKIFTQSKGSTEPTGQAALRHNKQNNLLDAYKVKCSESINDAKNNLTEYPKWKKILANIGLAIAGAGVFYGIAVLINKKVNNHYTFFNKARPNADKLETIEHEIDKTTLPGSPK